MIVRPYLHDDLFKLEQAGGFAHLYGKNIQRWINDEYVKTSDCYVFESEEKFIGGVCFHDYTEEESEILDFALINIKPNGYELLVQAINQALKYKIKQISYNLSLVSKINHPSLPCKLQIIA